MTMETLPLVALYVLSIVLLKWVEHRNFRRVRAEANSAVSSDKVPDDDLSKH
jgi:Sec-independent protein secretion pathway component TatC